MLDLTKQPHRRLNPLINEWILVSPQRTDRPWQGQTEKIVNETRPTYDPHCYLCPGNERAGGVRNPHYESTFVFENDFAALQPDSATQTYRQSELIVAEGEPGICRVICFAPRHDLTLARMSTTEIQEVVKVWTDQYRRLGQESFIKWVQIFENRGELMGASNPHPHCQVWANATLPNEPCKETNAQAAYRDKHHSCLLCDYLTIESRAGERVVCQNESFFALVPFWAVWPFETMVLSKRHVTALDQLDPKEQEHLADLLKELTTRYDNLFQTPFPYTAGFHQRPTDQQPHDEWHLHIHFYPPLLRSATVRKFMVGYEMLGSPQRDITAESAAQRLRSVPQQHYLEAAR